MFSATVSMSGSSASSLTTAELPLELAADSGVAAGHNSRRLEDATTSETVRFGDVHDAPSEDELAAFVAVADAIGGLGTLAGVIDSPVVVVRPSLS